MTGRLGMPRAFAVRLILSVPIFWIVLHGSAAWLGVPPDSWASVVWVVVMACALVCIEAKRLGYRVFLANLGVSRLRMWLPGWATVVAAEVTLQIVLAIW